MTIKELQLILNTTGWIFIGSGAYNQVYRSTKELEIGGYKGLWVLKTQLKPEDCSDKRRAVTKWKKINPRYPAFVTKQGWIAPYLGNKPATDEQIAMKVIDIYQQTRNIIADACILNNFLEHNGEVICIDVDQSIKRGSWVSDRFDFNGMEFINFLTNKEKVGFPRTTSVIKTLFYLEEQLSEPKIENKFITPGMLSKLEIFTRLKEPITVNVLKILLLIENSPSTSKIKNKYITPQLVRIIKYLTSEQITLTAQLIQSLIHSALLGRSTPDEIIKSGDLDDVQMLIQYDRTLLNNKTDKDGYNLLHLAAMYGHTEIVRYLLSEGLSPDTLTATNADSLHYQLSALDLAILFNRDLSTLLLIQAKVHFDIRQYVDRKHSLFFIAARTGDLSLIQLLLASYPELLHETDSCNQTALLWAAARGQEKVVQFFISAGVDINRATQLPSKGNEVPKEHNYTPLDWAIKNGQTATILILRQVGAVAHYQHEKVLNKDIKEHIEKGNLGHVQTLITHNPALLNQKDPRGFTPLHISVIYDQIEIARYLVAEGAHINIISTASVLTCENIRCPNMEAWSMAIHINRPEIASLLLASIKEQPLSGNKTLAILCAAENGIDTLVQRLVEEDASLVHAKDNLNQTPLLLAARKGHIAIVSYLLTQGADVNQPTKLPVDGYFPEQEENNYSPLDWAIKEGHAEVINLLTNAGARQNQTATRCEKNTISNHLALSLFNPGASSSNSSVLDVEVEEHFAGIEF